MFKNFRECLKTSTCFPDFRKYFILELFLYRSNSNKLSKLGIFMCHISDLSDSAQFRRAAAKVIFSYLDVRLGKHNSYSKLEQPVDFANICWWPIVLKGCFRKVVPMQDWVIPSALVAGSGWCKRFCSFSRPSQNNSSYGEGIFQWLGKAKAALLYWQDLAMKSFSYYSLWFESL